MPVGSNIFTGYQALGFVCNHVALSLRYHAKRKEHFVVTCVGKAFHTYNCSKLELLTISDTHANEINCLATDGNCEYTSCGNVIRAFSRGQQAIHTYLGHDKDVHILLPFGEHLISVDEGSNMKIWNRETEDLYLEVEFDNGTFQITCLVHPTTYLNKILLGSRQGALQLWNIKRNSLIHKFEGWGSPVTVLEQAPAVDVVAIGLEDGRILVHNIKYDETLVSFASDWGPVTAIAFRTDGEPIMVSGSTVGHIAVWNLEERKLQAQMRDAHQGSITGMKFLTSEPILVTNSPDNYLKMWVFDQADGSGRLLRRRCGHSAPPSRIAFYGTDGRNIISAGQDASLKSFSTFHESLNRDFGQAYQNKKQGKRHKKKSTHQKFGPITALACEPTKKSDWDSLAVCHQGSATVTTWDYTRCAAGKHKICPPELEDDLLAQATAVDITACGNFVLIGWSTGHVMLYNIQSGLHRGIFGVDKAHSMPVRGVAVDGLNLVTITASTDKHVKFWHFREKKLLQEVVLESAISMMKLHRESSMLALAMDNFSICVMDVDLQRVVRKFTGHRNVISDMTFSSDARWLVSASMDCSVRVWDLPTAKMVDYFLVDAAVTSLAMSPTNAYLATSHVDDLGIYLWSNRTLYCHVTLRPLPADYEPSVILMPGASLETDSGDDEESSTADRSDLPLEYESPEQIDAQLVTLSVLPNSRWQSLTNLDLIKKRNKPKQPPKVPKSAPFFLPVISGLEPALDTKKRDGAEEVCNKYIICFPLKICLSICQQSKVKFLHSLNLASELCQLLMKPSEGDAVMDYLMKLNPSATDSEIRSLAPIGGGSHATMATFLEFLIQRSESNQNFELVQAYISLFLKIHGDEIASTPSLLEPLEKLLSVQCDSWQRIDGQFHQTMCLINYMKSAVL